MFLINVPKTTRHTISALRIGAATQQRWFATSDESLPPFTSERYSVKRGQFEILNDRDVAHFESLLGKEHVLTDSFDTQPYNVEFLRHVRGRSSLVLLPSSTEQVSAVLRHCNARRLAVCPQSGNTGLVGGSVPVFDEIVLSMRRLARIERIDALSGVLECEAGCVLQTLSEAVAEHGLCMPLDLGSKGSCCIGGNLSTNAGGLRLLRYGNLHGSVLGVEAVKADGTVLDVMSALRKDNTGYHLKHLFVGSEGTLGVLTRVAIACPSASRAISVAFLGLASYEAVLQTFRAAKRDLGEILSSCELIDSDSLEASVAAYDLRSPISAEYPFYMLIETSGSNAEHDEAKLNAFLARVLDGGQVLNGTVTNEPSKMQAIWAIRERIATALMRDGHVFKYDLTLPLGQFYDIVLAARRRLDGVAHRVCGYGHVGDANLHLNVTSAEDRRPTVQALLEPWAYEFTAALGGSVSAEHGIGLWKTRYLGHSKRPAAIDQMRQLKRLMDPNGILNPYKVLPEPDGDK